MQEVTTRKVVTIGEDSPLDEVVALMESWNIKRLPIARRNRVVGIVSRANLLRALASIYRSASKASKNDGSVRDRILANIAEQSWAAGVAVDVMVRKGIADLWGSVSERAQAAPLKVLVENTPGVKEVKIHLTWRGAPITAR